MNSGPQTQSGRARRRRNARAFAIARLAALPAILTFVITEPRSLGTSGAVALAAVVAWNLGSVASALWVQRRPISPLVMTIGDTTTLAVLMLVSDSAYDGLAPFLPALLLAPVLALPPRATVNVCVSAVVGFALVSIPEFHEGHSLRSFAITEAAFLWITVVCVILARVRTENRTRLQQAVEQRRQLLADVLEIEAKERRDTATVLHEGPLQLLLCARQDLEEGRETNDEELLEMAHQGLIDAVASLRQAIAYVHPVALDHGGLGAALQAVADEAAKDGGFRSEVTVDQRAVGIADQVIVDLARMALANVAEHAGAGLAQVHVGVIGRSLVLTVRDDGRGFTGDERPAGNGVALAAASERVAALGGALEVITAPEQGTRISARLPLA